MYSQTAIGITLDWLGMGWSINQYIWLGLMRNTLKCEQNKIWRNTRK